jgi:hypothetical protein
MNKLIVFLSSLIVSSYVQAALVIDIDPANVSRDSVNSPGILDLYIHSDTGPVNLAIFNFQISLTDITSEQIGGSRTGSVYFSAVQPNQGQLQPNYVFNPLAQADQFITTRQGFLTPDGNGSDAIAVGDSTFNAAFEYPTVEIGNVRRLLARLNIYQEQPAGTSGTPRGVFRVDLSIDPLKTGFYADENQIPLPFVQQSSGFITVSGASAVPEPSTFVMVGLVMGGIAMRHRYRRA